MSNRKGRKLRTALAMGLVLSRHSSELPFSSRKQHGMGTSGLSLVRASSPRRSYFFTLLLPSTTRCPARSPGAGTATGRLLNTAGTDNDPGNGGRGADDRSCHTAPHHGNQSAGALATKNNTFGRCMTSLFYFLSEQCISGTLPLSSSRILCRHICQPQQGSQ